jgi:hypothetical protein
MSRDDDGDVPSEGDGERVCRARTCGLTVQLLLCQGFWRLEPGLSIVSDGGQKCLEMRRCAPGSGGRSISSRPASSPLSSSSPSHQGASHPPCRIAPPCRKGSILHRCSSASMTRGQGGAYTTYAELYSLPGRPPLFQVEPRSS